MLKAKLTHGLMSIQGGPDFYLGGRRIASTKVHAPVHETMTLAALINSDYKLDPKTTLTSLLKNPTSHSEINDFIRGVVWNDDPACELFTNNCNGNNLEYSTAVNWARIFMESKTGFMSLDKPNLIGRSHFGDLQWLHAMGSSVGEEPRKTKAKILLWMEVMYNVAIGSSELTPATRIEDTPLASVFEDPRNYSTLGELFTRRHSPPVNVHHRALGSCFHVIQDSYATGHTQRERSFSNGREKFGAVVNFHTYRGQDSGAHDRYDHSDGSGMPHDLRDLEAWDGMSGCRDGVDNCITLAKFWCRKASWEGEVRPWLSDEVFQLSKKAGGSDAAV